MSVDTSIRSTPLAPTARGLAMPIVLSPLWRWPQLIGCHLAALILAATWLCSPTRALWDRLDILLFRMLNGSLDFGHGWQLFWAYANWRPVDGLAAVVLLLVFIHSIRRDERMLQLALWSYLLLIGLCVIIVKPITLLLLHDTLEYYRPSPTLMVDASLRLSALVPTVSAKDASPWCFPSDHGFVLLTFTSMYWYLGRRRAAVTASFIALLFTLPRMVSGAHWATDTLVGGAVMTLVATSWVFATPLHHHVARLCFPLVRRFDAVLPPWQTGPP